MPFIASGGFGNFQSSTSGPLTAADWAASSFQRSGSFEDGQTGGSDRGDGSDDGGHEFGRAHSDEGWPSPSEDSTPFVDLDAASYRQAQIQAQGRPGQSHTSPSRLETPSSLRSRKRSSSAQDVSSSMKASPSSWNTRYRRLRFEERDTQSSHEITSCRIANSMSPARPPGSGRSRPRRSRSDGEAGAEERRRGYLYMRVE